MLAALLQGWVRVREVGEGQLGWKREGGVTVGKGETIKWDDSVSGEGRQEESLHYMLQARAIIQNKHLKFSCTHTVLH